MPHQRLRLITVVAITAVTYVIALLLQGDSVNWGRLQPFAAAIGVLSVVHFAFDQWLWRIRLLRPWLVDRPDLRGTWRVQLQSDYVRPETGLRVRPITCYMGIKQTLSEMQMHLMTPESESWLLASHFEKSDSGGGFRVTGVYRNTPHLDLRSSRVSEIHHGAIVVDTHGDDHRPRTLTATYWTDRKTVGIMEFTDRVDEVFTRFRDADRCFSEDEDHQ